MTTHSTQSVLEIRSLTKHYGGVKALTDANFRLMPGEHVAIVGDNGAGKSTFVRLITGAEQPNSGDLLLDGKLEFLLDGVLGIALPRLHISPNSIAPNR